MLLTNPLPINRNSLIAETKMIYGPALSSLRNGWSKTAKKKFPELYAQRDRLYMCADGVLMYNDVPVIPPTLRELLLQHLHSSHLGRDKMKEVFCSLDLLVAFYESRRYELCH